MNNKRFWGVLTALILLAGIVTVLMANANAQPASDSQTNNQPATCPDGSEPIK